MSREATRGMSAPPEVVFSTATDPDRRGAWLPPGLEVGPAGQQGDDAFEVRLTAGGDHGVLRVRANPSGGSSVDLSVPGSDPGPEKILESLDREVSDNLNAG